jgi:hypothetical protein
MRRAVSAALALVGGALVVLTVTAYFFSTFCWEYCEPEDAPTFWDGFKFALPFGILALGLTTAAVTVFTRGRGSSLRAVLVAFGACVVCGLLFAGWVAWYDGPEDHTAAWVGAPLVVVAWMALTAAAARRFADPA